jgi:hypothetical protein
VTNLRNAPVGTRIFTTNADGSLTIETLVAREEYNVTLWFTIILVIALVLLVAFKVAKKNAPGGGNR